MSLNANHKTGIDKGLQEVRVVGNLENPSHKGALKANDKDSRRGQGFGQDGHQSAMKFVGDRILGL
jgi:hypothetical protein